MAQVNIRIEDGLKEKADELFEALGINMTTAFNMFIKSSIRQKGIPFSLNLDISNNDIKINSKKRKYSSRCIIEPDKSKKPVFGCMKDSIEIPLDFYEPLDEMKEYMY